MQLHLLRRRGFLIHKGSSFVSTVLWLLVAVLAFQIGTKLMPVYLEDYYIKQSLESLANDNNLSELSPEDIRHQLTKSFRVNNIQGAAANSLKVTPVDNTIIVDMEYERRIAFIYNIHAVLLFHHRLDRSKPHQCCNP